MAEKALSIFSFIFALFFLIISFQIQTRSSAGVTASDWPAALMGMMLILAIILIYNTFKKTDKLADHDEIDILDEEDELVYPVKLYYMLAILIVYTVGLYYIGFIISTFLLLLLLTTLFDIKTWVNRIVISLVSTVFFIFVFPILLNLPFPRGFGIFREMSLLFF